MNVLDEVPWSYSHQGNPKLDQPKYILKTRDHESMDSEMVRLYQGFVHFVRKDI